MVDGQNFFDQSVRNDLITHAIFNNKAAPGQRDGCTTGCLLDYNYIRDY